ncbi:MAG: type III pantothenate kinase [Flavobacteriaceae bacterium]|nr:type III pantothenate kinase [Pelagibacterales bacterium]MBT4709495.1 type III pantothenate kinase [Flavobacteriaceae bacterium]MBT4959445.1 type III pantothenate kinase [Flavobacteriaceae bacterium]MBT6169642.1 type III pantothenate kinase [Flavobacteriaceae bacterium]MBT6447768.1 type III pantothenate kinase [Flavobacteriaceae bacterium]
MNLALDIGNSFLKAGIFKNNNLINYYEFNREYYSNIKSILDKTPITHSIASNVSESNNKLIELLSNKTNLIKFNSSLKVPFKNCYQTKNTLGKDRIALVSNASKEYPKENVLLIDLGSCITFDFLNSKNEYLGGSISPGLSMRYKSLNSYTANLPLINPKEIDYFIGRNTEDSIHSGIINGIVGELNSAIDKYKSQFKEIRIILTGGDSKFLFNRIKNSIFANSNFLILGLNFLIELNKK